MDIIVKYGSKARGDSDLLSDSDVLVIGKIPDELRTANSEIVRYTKNRLEKLKTVRSLFLIHLREEGLIIRDHNNWMGNFLKTIPDYTASEESIKDALKNLSIITSIIPTVKGIACWYDMLFVFLRDLLIKLNSKNKKYIFTPNRLLESIKIKHKEQIQNIINISREIKSNYRNSIEQTVFIEPLRASAILIDCFNLKNTCPNFFEIVNKPLGYDPYLVLRLVEYGICTGSIRPIDENIIKYIKNPNRYSWDIKKIKWNDKVKFVEQQQSSSAQRAGSFQTQSREYWIIKKP